MRGPFVQRETLRWSDADLQGLVNNAVFLTLFEQARFAYFSHLRLLDGSAFPFLLGSTNVRFVRPARPGMTIEVETRVVRLGTKSFDMAYRVAHDGETLADGGATLVWIDRKLQSQAIPDHARRAIVEYEDLDLGGPW